MKRNSYAPSAPGFRRHLLHVTALLLGGCNVTPLVLCDQIPEGGCPLDRGGTCEDASCAALYGCYDGVWERVELCQGNTGGAGGGAPGSGGTGGAAAAGGTGGAGCTPIMFDHTDDTTGCMPDLQSPDCPAAAAEQCPGKACTTGCLDFFLCKPTGWEAVAYCDEDGNFFEAPR
jgi:hypothetical protein